MKTPEHRRTYRDPRCKDPSLQSPFAMMDPHVKQFNCESAELQTDRHTHTHTHAGPILLPQPLMQEVMIYIYII